MARTFNVEVFRRVINTGVTYYSDPQYDELLGSADVVTIQAIVDATPGAATVSAQFQTSNDGAPNASVWQNPTNFSTASPAPSGASDVPKAAMTRSRLDDGMGMRGRVAVSTSAQTGVAVRVIACGRSFSKGDG